MGDDSSLLFDIPRRPGTAFRKGFREKSHFCLKAAIQELYADAGLIEHNDRDALNNGMLRRQKSSGEQIADLFAKE